MPWWWNIRDRLIRECEVRETVCVRIRNGNVEEKWRRGRGWERSADAFKGSPNLLLDSSPLVRRLNGLTPKRETPQFARRVASCCTLVGTLSPSNPNPTAHRRRVQKSTKQRHPVCCIIQRSPECKDPGSCTTWRSTRNNQHLDAQI